MISVTSKSRYAVVALAELARSGERPVPIAQIAERRAMPVQFLEQLFTTLRRDGLLQSHRGVKGGYTLARPPEEITVLEVVQSLDGKVGEEGKEAGGIWERGRRGPPRRLPTNHDRRHRPPRGRGGRRGHVPHLEGVPSASNALNPRGRRPMDGAWTTNAIRTSSGRLGVRRDRGGRLPRQLRTELEARDLGRTRLARRVRAAR